MTLFKCKRCLMLISDHICRNEKDIKLCERCLKEVSIIRTDCKDKCPVCLGKCIDYRVYPPVPCSCINLSIGEIESS
jgi:hypothetical protein